MSYVMGYGSDFTTISATVGAGATTADSTLVASGVCTFDGVVVSVGNVPIDVTLTLKDGDGTTIHAWQFDPTGAALVRDGIRCGPQGMRSGNGLKFSVTNNTGGAGLVSFSLLYRSIFP